MKNGIASIVKLLTPSNIILMIVVGLVPGMQSIDRNVEISIAKVTGTLNAIKRKNPPMRMIPASKFISISSFLL